MKKRSRRKPTSDRARVARVREFLHLGFKDYIGARTLLLSRLPLQGAVLGSTAIEKYLKAIAAVRGNEIHGHLRAAHMNALRNYVPELFESLNSEFLSFLQHCYRLRYTDRLPVGFNLVVYGREVLAELDHTVFRCEFQVNLRQASGEQALTAYRHALAKKSKLLLRENHVLLQQDKGTFLKQESAAYAMRNRGLEGILEVEFEVFESPSDGHFEREALRLVSPEEASTASRTY